MCEVLSCVWPFTNLVAGQGAVVADGTDMPSLGLFKRLQVTGDQGMHASRAHTFRYVERIVATNEMGRLFQGIHGSRSRDLQA